MHLFLKPYLILTILGELQNFQILRFFNTFCIVIVTKNYKDKVIIYYIFSRIFVRVNSRIGQRIQLEGTFLRCKKRKRFQV